MQLLKALRLTSSRKIVVQNFTAGLKRIRRSEMTGLVAVMQLCSTNDKQKNFEMCSNLIREAKQRGAVMAFLPENSDFVAGSKDETLALAEPFDLSDTPSDQTVLGKYRLLSKELKIWLSIGGLHRLMSNETSEPKRLWNTHVVIDDSGRVMATYEKLHLFDAHVDKQRDSEGEAGRMSHRESAVSHRGSRLLQPVATPAGHVALSICYDLRFPELASWQRARGAQLLTYPSAFTYATGVMHWETLLRARAIETQCYVLAAAQTGQHNATRRSYGHAMVVDPLGCVRAQVREGVVGSCFADVDLDELARVRLQMPVAAHRRVDLFGPADAAPAASESLLTDTAEPVPFCVDRMFGPHKVAADCVFYESPWSFAFVNLRPIVPGHVLVVPKRLVARAVDLKDAEASDLFRVALLVQRVLEAHYNASAANVAMQDGPAAGQSVPHVHIHIIPRRPGDFKKSDDVHDALENWEKVRVNRTLEEMRNEALVYRKLFESRLQ